MIVSSGRTCEYCEAEVSSGHVCAQLAEALVGRVVGRKYEIVSLLGKGGMGTVVRALHQGLRRHFAIKVLNQRFRSDERMVRRFAHEARLVGSLHSEHVVSVVDFGVDQELGPFLVMEELEGESLSHLLAQGALSASRAVDIVSQAAVGLCAAHDAGLIHRDLKPSNLFVSRRDQGGDWVKILDFGIARSEELQSDSSLSGCLVGTAAYMSPEQARGDRIMDARIDIYALGAILYECLARRRAHPGTDYNQIIYHILSQQPEALPESLGPLRTIVEKAMERAPDDRFQTAHHFRAALAEAAVEGAGQRGASMTATMTAVEAPRSTPGGARGGALRRHGLRALLMAGTGVAGLLLGFRLNTTAPSRPPVAMPAGQTAPTADRPRHAAPAAPNPTLPLGPAPDPSPPARSAAPPPIVSTSPPTVTSGSTPAPAPRVAAMRRRAPDKADSTTVVKEQGPSFDRVNPYR